MPTYTHTSESLREFHDRMMLVGPSGWMSRTSLDDYVDLTEVLE